MPSIFSEEKRVSDTVLVFIAKHCNGHFPLEHDISDATITISLFARRSIGFAVLLWITLDPVAAMAGSSGRPASAAEACHVEDFDGPAGRDPAVLVWLMQCLERGKRHGLVALVARRLLALDAHVALAKEALAKALAQGSSDVDAPGPTEWGGRLAFELGYDSNINRGALVDEISIPLLDNRVVPLDPLLKEKSSIFLGTQLGGWAGLRLAGGWFGSIQGDIDARLNSSEHLYLPHNRRLALRFGRHMGALDAVVTAAGRAQNIGKHLIVDGSHVSASMRWAFLPQKRISFSVSTSQTHYPRYHGLTLQGVNWGIGLEHLARGLQAAFMRGSERSGTADRSLDRDYSGIGAGWRRRIGDGEAVATVNWFQTRYVQSSALFGLIRDEDWSQMVLAYEKPIGNSWMLIPRLIVERNETNLAATAYRRHVFSFEVRKDF